MSLIEIRADLTRTADALTRLADAGERVALALERAFPAPQSIDTSAYRQATAEDVHYTDDDKTAMTAAGKALFAELHAVVPDSEAFAKAMLAYEQEMAVAYGAGHEIDWEEIFSRLAQNAS